MNYTMSGGIMKDLIRYLKTGGWKTTKQTHDFLRRKKHKISRKHLLRLLPEIADQGADTNSGMHTWISSD